MLKAMFHKIIQPKIVRYFDVRSIIKSRNVRSVILTSQPKSKHPNQFETELFIILTSETKKTTYQSETEKKIG